MEKIIMKKLMYKRILTLFSCITLVIPCSVAASTVYIDSAHSDFFVGDTILFNVRVDSENKEVNAVEGSILLDHSSDSASLTDINTSGSRFSLWPGKPLPAASNTEISFSGGIPGGVKSTNAIIFNIVLQLQKPGPLTLTPDNISVYLNDGRGTKDEVRIKGLVLDVLPNKSDPQAVDDWSRLLLNDTTPPEPFEIYPGQERSVFDGKKFLSFNTTDAQSDIAYYEVRENALPPVRSSDTYVLQEQDKPVKVTITAYDSAGNSRESSYTSDAKSYIVYIIAILILIVLLIVVIFRNIRKNKK